MPQVKGAEAEGSWASSTFPEDLVSARNVPSCESPKMGHVKISWGGRLVLGLASIRFPTSLSQDLNFPLRIPCPLHCHRDETNNQGALAGGWA